MFEKLKFYSLIGIGVLIGILIVSTIKHGGINLVSLSQTTSMAVILFISYFFIRKGTRKVEIKSS